MTIKKSQHEFEPILAALLDELRRHGIEPILVGGMALVLLGSRRVTRDFDFLIKRNAEKPREIIEIMYSLGFELASRLDEKNGDIIEVLDNVNVAGIRVELDSPSTVFFRHATTGLRVDLLLDFPVPAEELIAESKTTKLSNGILLRIASKSDLLKLKKIAFSDRGTAADAQDIELLKRLIT